MENRLKELREERKLSLRGMEIKTGINYGTIASYEKCIRDIGTDTAKHLAAFFEVSLDYLLNYDGFCLYVTYENSKTVYRIDNRDYQLLKDYIYFNNEVKLKEEEGIDLLHHNIISYKDNYIYDCVYGIIRSLINASALVHTIVYLYDAKLEE